MIPSFAAILPLATAWSTIAAWTLVAVCLKLTCEAHLVSHNSGHCREACSLFWRGELFNIDREDAVWCVVRVGLLGQHSLLFGEIDISITSHNAQQRRVGVP